MEDTALLRRWIPYNFRVNQHHLCIIIEVSMCKKMYVADGGGAARTYLRELTGGDDFVCLRVDNTPFTIVLYVWWNA
jgi:hypothetical protein